LSLQPIEQTGIARAPAARLQQELGKRLRLHLYDESQMTPAGIAIYSLADPRDVRTSRYVGQTAHPRRRLVQHVRTARLSLVDDTPWWVRTPQLRPLYSWIRELYAQDARLPVMLVHSWVQAEQAHEAERERIHSALHHGLPLLNVAVGKAGAAAGTQPRL
jgi:hypothetical protein